ncbi:MAG: hypothetical protein ABI763_06205 [Bacteroidota bacterium]
MKRFTSKLIFSLLTGSVIVLSSCNVINPEEEIPAYIEVDSIGVFTYLQTQGSATSNIVDAWVTIDGAFLCGYNLGTKVPVLYNGMHTVTIRAGILLNGIEGTRVPYAVFTSFDTLIDLKPGAIHKFIPRVTYLSSTVFPLDEDFNSSSLLFSTPVSSAAITVETGGIDGDNGLVVMDAINTSFECTTTDSFDLPGGLKPTYIEIDYKCNTDFSVGVKANTTLGPLDFPVLGIRSTDTWKKIYVNLTSITSQATQARDWKIYIKSSLAPGATTDTLRFDNIKLVY